MREHRDDSARFTRRAADRRRIHEVKLRTPEHVDKQLARRILDGDEQAFEEFFESNAPALYRFILSRVGNRDAHHVEELTQTTLLKSVSRLETYRGEASLFTWMCALSRGEFADFRKRRRREPWLVEFDEQQGAANAATAGSIDNPDEAFGRKELASEVHAVLDDLPPPYGEVLEWKYIDGLSASEIAGRLGLSTKAAESALSRAREAFRTLFTRRSRPRDSRGLGFGARRSR